MNSIALPSLCILGSGLAAFLASSLPNAQGPPVAASGVDGDRAELMRFVASVESRLDILEARPTLAPIAASNRTSAGATELPTDEITALVRSLVEDGSLVQDKDAPVGWPGGALSASDAIRAILEAGVNSPEASELWAEAAANGQLHGLLAEMERQMEDVPESADKHFDRARAYYAAAGSFPSNNDGNWWVDSNMAFDKALEYDPEHWDARYQKARNMAFWPVAYGGQAEAVRHFETLADQQEHRPSETRHAKTYVWLGNLYDQQGKTDAARAAWERGLARFPGNSQLLGRLATLNQ